MNISDKLNLIVYIVLLLILLCSSIASELAEEWKGHWFPMKPGENDPYLKDITITHNDINNNSSFIKTMGITDPKCDDAKQNLWMDYDPKNISHHSRYLCWQDRKKFEPKLTVQPILKEYKIPDEYSALHRCMNESIDYDYTIPTFGAHRPVWPVYGEYDYVPVQRWIHNLEHGAIVAVYHPCVNKRQLNDFRKLVKKCLYRHIITPYEKLDAERPFAIIAWGRSLEFSVIDNEQIVAFIRMNALQGPEKVSRNGQYISGIIERSSVVSDADDNSLCPNM